MAREDRQEVVVEDWLADLNTSTDHIDQTFFLLLICSMSLGDIPLKATSALYGLAADSLCLSTNT